MIMKNLYIYFDNTTYKFNNIIYNYIKRFIVYEIINKKYINNEYDDIFLFKTSPDIVKIKLNNKNDIEDVSNILFSINNVIYKYYKIYPSMNFKNIIDSIEKIELDEPDKENDIIIICSIDKIDSFNDGNKIYISDKINKFKSNIKFINISNSKFLNIISNKINEFFIDIKNLKIENMFLKDIFSLKQDNYPINIFEKYFCFNENNKVDISIDIDNSIELYEYILYLSYIEKILLLNLDNIEQLENLKKYNNGLEIKINSTNNCLLNIIKSYQNSIKNIQCRFSESNIKIPIDKLNDIQTNSYIKYILEFYEIVYPKIFKYNLKISNTFNLKKSININDNKTSLIKLDNFISIDESDINDLSLDYLKSTLSLTNWLEEYNNLNPFGIIIKFIPNKYSYKGIIDLNSSIIKTYPNMVLDNVTTNWVSMYDYYQIILSEFESSESENDYDYVNKDKTIFNIGNFNIIDKIHGDGNIMLPVYINKNHWGLTKSIWNYHMSFIFNSFEFEYTKKMDNIYFLSLLKHIKNLKDSNLNNSKLNIRLFCYLLRTSIQILIDNKYLHGISSEYPKQFNNLLKIENIENNSILSEWIIKLIQLIVSNGDSEKIAKDILTIRNLLFNKSIIKNYKMDYWDLINNQDTPKCKIINELDILKNNVLEENICWLYLEHDLILLNKIIKSIYLIKGFNQFIKQIDKTNGYLNEQDLTNIDLKTFTTIIKNINSIQFNINNYSVNISEYCEY